MKKLPPKSIVKNHLALFKSQKEKFQGGFTLIETLVAIFVFVLAMGAISGSVVLMYRTHDYTWEQSRAIDEARRGIEVMTKEIRAARTGDNGAYPIEKAEDRQFVFYSDIDGDGKAERVRYFLSTATSTESKSQTKECSTASTGGACSATFSNFFNGILKSASLTVSVKGDFDSSSEYAAILADGTTLISDICRYSCSNCPTYYQGTTTFDVINRAGDNQIQFTADANSSVGHDCTIPNHHSMWARFELNWTEEFTSTGTQFLKGVIDPVGDPAEYPSGNEQISVLTSYIRNPPPVFEYFDENGEKITSLPVRLVDTKLMKTYLVVNIDPNRPPEEFELESFVQLRNLRSE